MKSETNEFDNMLVGDYLDYTNLSRLTYSQALLKAKKEAWQIKMIRLADGKRRLIRVE